MWDEGITSGLECIVPCGSPLCLKHGKALRGGFFTWTLGTWLLALALHFAKPSLQGLPQYIMHCFSIVMFAYFMVAFCCCLLRYCCMFKPKGTVPSDLSITMHTQRRQFCAIELQSLTNMCYFIWYNFIGSIYSSDWTMSHGAIMLLSMGKSSKIWSCFHLCHMDDEISCMHWV